MALKKMTLAQFRDAYNRSGESVMQLAEIVAETISDDRELVGLAKAALKAEDEFLAALNNRDIQL